MAIGKRALISVIFLLALPLASFAGEKKEAFPFKQRSDISAARPATIQGTKKPAKVKLRRLSDGTYTWEISGDDLSEVIRTDKRLRETYGAKDEAEAK